MNFLAAGSPCWRPRGCVARRDAAGPGAEAPTPGEAAKTPRSRPPPRPPGRSSPGWPRPTPGPGRIEDEGEAVLVFSGRAGRRHGEAAVPHAVRPPQAVPLRVLGARRRRRRPIGNASSSGATRPPSGPGPGGPSGPRSGRTRSAWPSGPAAGVSGAHVLHRPQPADARGPGPGLPGWASKEPELAGEEASTGLPCRKLEGVNVAGRPRPSGSTGDVPDPEDVHRGPDPRRHGRADDDLPPEDRRQDPRRSSSPSSRRSRDRPAAGPGVT